MKKNLFILVYLFAGFSLFAQTTFSCSNASTICACGGMGSITADFYAGYFSDNQSYFTTNSPGLTRNDANINYTTDNWGAIVPPATGSVADPNAYSTRWSGAIYLAAGTYTFWLTSDDASWMWLGASALATTPSSATAFINNSGLHSAATVSSIGIFTTNCLQDIKVHFGENTGNNRCYLEYACNSPSITRQAVPSTAFCKCQSNAILPIELKDFYAKANKDNIMLYWNTASEKNNRLFTVYKSLDGTNWSVIGEQPGAGTSINGKSYSMADKDPALGLNYYYLMQTDEDGGSKKFDVAVVDFTKSESYLKLFPNPFQDKFMVTSSTAWNSADAIEIYDAMGLPVNIPISQTDSRSFELNTLVLPKGSYVIKIITAYQVVVKKLVKN